MYYRGRGIMRHLEILPMASAALYSTPLFNQPESLIYPCSLWYWTQRGHFDTDDSLPICLWCTVCHRTVAEIYDFTKNHVSCSARFCEHLTAKCSFIPIVLLPLVPLLYNLLHSVTSSLNSIPGLPAIHRSLFGFAEKRSRSRFDGERYTFASCTNGR